MSKAKLLFLAIDGLDYDLVRKYDCSFLQWLMLGNQHGVLISNDPSGCDRYGGPMTGPAWTTIYTGVPASVHGLDCQKWFQGKSAHFEIKVPTIWRILEKHHSLGLMALPAYEPAGRQVKKIDDWAINGFPCVGQVKKIHIYPPDLAIPDGFRLEEFTASLKPDKRPEDVFGEQGRQADEKLDVALALPRQEIMGIGIQMVDWASHDKLDRSEEYAFVDKWINRAYSHFRPENFMLCSDHGFEENQRKHREAGIYVCSLPGGEIPRTIYDVASLTLFIMGR